MNQSENIKQQSNIPESLFSSREGPFLRQIMDSFPFGLIIINEEDTIIFINSVGALLMDVQPGIQNPGLKVTEFFLPVPGAFREKWNLSDDAFKSEYNLKKRDGKTIPILKSSNSNIYGDFKLKVETFYDISERKEKLADLWESKRQFSTLMSNLPGMVYQCRNDKNWTMEFISEGCYELTGYKPDELVFNNVKSYNDLIVLEDQERIWQEVQNKIQTGKPFPLEYRIRCADGKLKWVWEKANSVYNQDGELIHIEGFITDITDKRNAELLKDVVFNISNASFTAGSLDELFQQIHKNLEKIIDVENLYVAMYDRENDTISIPYQVDSKDKFASFPAGKTLTGYVIRLGKPLLITKPEIEDLARQGHIQIIGTPAEVWLGVPLIVNESVTGVLAVQSYQDPGRYSVSELELLTFVADQIATSISRRRAEDSLQREKALLDQLFEGSTEAIVMIDNSGTILMANSEFVRLFGYSQSEIIGNNVDNLIAPPHNREEAIRITSDIVRGKDYEVETVRKRKDDTLVDVSILVTPIMLQNTIFGAYGIYRDITARKQVEKSLISAKEKAEEADKLKSAFLSNMSHEIRTPMNAILGFSALLSDPGLSENEKLEFIQIIKDRGTDLMKIIDDIIDISKIESGQMSFEIKEFPINILMNNLMVTLNELKRKHDKSQVQLNCYPEISKPEFTIPTDGNRLRQILTNLIENAIKFTDEGRIDFGYTLHKETESPYIEFFVRDTGIGIPPDKHALIFERFRQADGSATRKYGGTGLGLTIARNLSRLLGGDIGIESEQGKGTTFQVRLPLPSDKPGKIRFETPKPAKPQSQKWEGKSILIAEDEESNYMLLFRILRSTGVSITWAKNGIEAIELIKNQHFDLVLMDIRMPVIDGYETTQVIRKTNSDLIIIAQTAFAFKGEREKALAAGCNNYIAKPIDISELFTILAKYLNK